MSGEEKPSWSSSSSAEESSSHGSSEEAQKVIPNIVKPSPSSTSAPSSSSAPEPSSGSAEAAAAPEEPQGSPTFVYTLPLEGGKVVNPYSGGQLVKNQTLNVWRTHDAVDIQGEKGAKVFAIGDGKVVSAQTGQDVYPFRLRLYELEERLDRTRFARISSGEIVNLDRVTSLDLSLSGTIRMTLDGGIQTYVSRRYVKKIKETLHLGRRNQNGDN